MIHTHRSRSQYSLRYGCYQNELKFPRRYTLPVCPDFAIGQELLLGGAGLVGTALWIPIRGQSPKLRAGYTAGMANLAHSGLSQPKGPKRVPQEQNNHA